MGTDLLEMPCAIANGHRADRQVHRMEFVRMDHTQSSHRVMMCALADRIPVFLSMIGSQEPSELIQRALHSQWLMGSNTLAIWAAQSLDGALIGHVISQIERAWGVPYVMILQVEVDAPYTTTGAQRRALLADMDVWARSQGATQMKTLTSRSTAAYPRHCGFTVADVVMVRPVGQP